MTDDHGIRVLLVDDNPDDRALVRREAEALYPNAQIREVGSREDFDDAVKSDSHELIVTDLHLKWGNGREVLAAVRLAWPGCAVSTITS
jgi:CheY-like chemotaxis protein